MKKLLNFLILGFVLVLFTNASCTEPDPPIPTGDHTFSCRINGELFIPKATGDAWSTLPTGDGLEFLKYNNDLSYSVKASNSEYRVYFNIINWKLGTFILADSNGLFGYSQGDPGEINHAIVIKNGLKYLSKQGSGNITFTEVNDTDKNKKGTFKFTLYNEQNTNDVLEITNGQFDN